jgi:hypothetical protein
MVKQMKMYNYVMLCDKFFEYGYEVRKITRECIILIYDHDDECFCEIRLINQYEKIISKMYNFITLYPLTDVQKIKVKEKLRRLK